MLKGKENIIPITQAITGIQMEHFFKRYHPPGTAPGTLSSPEVSPEGEAGEALPSVHIHVVDYDREHFEEKDHSTPDECKHYLESPAITWIHVQGHVGADALQQLGDLFSLHPLALEDVINSGQRPKVEAYDQQTFIVLSFPRLVESVVRIEQVSIFFGENYIISFHDGEQNPFEPVYKRLRASAGMNNGRFRRKGTDYLLYSLLDRVIDEGFPVLETLGEQIEALEEDLLEKPEKHTPHQIHAIKRELLILRRMLWPQREVVNALLRSEEEGISEDTKIYLRDCYDHTIQIMDLIETYRDMTAGMIDIYLSGISNGMNEVMRVLTIIATLFIPPTFIAGIYGMNFDSSAGPLNMPELGWRYGYLFAWGVIALMIGGLLVYFKRKRWF